MVAVSTLYVGVYAWPASVAPTRWVWGSHGDALGNAFLFTWVDQAILLGRSGSIDTQIAIPFGENLLALPHEPIFFWAQLLLAAVVGAVASLNLISFLAVPLTTWVMYRLALHVTNSAPAAFFAGIAYGCSTFVLSNTRGEPTLAQVWIFPLAVWALLKLMESPGRRAVVIAAVAVAASAVVNFYFTMFAALMCAVLVLSWNIAAFVLTRRLALRPLVASAVAGLLGAAIAGLLFAGSLGNLQQRAQATVRPTTRLEDLASGLLDFVLPSQWNPWLGGLATARFLAREATTGVHFGLSQMVIPAAVLLLVPFGLVLLFLHIGGRSWWEGDPANDPKRLNRTLNLIALFCVGVLGLWLTIPPTAFPHALRVLSLQVDIHHFFPEYQHFSRATVLLCLGAVPLAAIAVGWVARRWPSVSVPLALVLAASVLVEGYEVIPDSALEVVSPPAYAWVAAQPGTYAIADYPLLPAGSGGNEYTYLFDQRFHGHPVLNGVLAETESESMREEFRDPNRADVPSHLAALGVRYLLWHPDVLASFHRLSETLAAPYDGWVPRAPGYRLEASFPDGSAVYSVTAQPSDAFAFFAAGFGPVQRAPDGRTARAVTSGTGPARIDIYSPGPPAPLDLRFDCFGRGGSVQLRASGRTVASSELPQGSPGKIAVRVAANSGLTALELVRLPGSSSADAATLCTFITTSR